jgi:hypothetical protein
MLFSENDENEEGTPISHRHAPQKYGNKRNN